MTRKARLWVGLTLLLVLIFNYALIGFPLIKREASIKDQTKLILIKQVKSSKVFKNSTDDYMLDILRKEKTSLDRKILILNCVGISISILVASWVIFGLIMHRK